MLDCRGMVTGVEITGIVEQRGTKMAERRAQVGPIALRARTNAVCHHLLTPSKIVEAPSQEGPILRRRPAPVSLGAARDRNALPAIALRVVKEVQGPIGLLQIP